jgi:CHASE2 domain-containing sensor protein
LYYIFRWLITSTLGILGAWLTALNWSCIVIWYARRRHHSMIPLVGGGSLALALLACPMAGTTRWAWIPLIVDPGCLLMMLLLVPLTMKTRGFRHELNQGQEQERMQS